MFCLIWVPSPNSTRPPDRIDRSQAAYATRVGLRTNASVTAVRTVTRVVCSRASRATAGESWTVSATCRPSNPSSSTRRA
jgi:hypothetical protein